MKRLACSIAPALALAACGSDPPVSAGGSGGVASTTSATMSSASASSATGGSGGATTSHTTSSSIVTTSGGGSTPLPDQFTITGVVTDGASPVEGAIVLQGGKAPAFTTGPDGAFTIDVVNDVGIPTVVAAKIGYRSGGFEVYDLPQGPIEIVIRYAAPPDNPSYVYGPPGHGDPTTDTSTAICGHCHASYARDFRASGHAKSAKNPWVQGLYAGVAEIGDQATCEARGGVWRMGTSPGTTMTGSKCYVGRGVLPDLNPCGAPAGLSCDDPALDTAQKPMAYGRCADCHAPGIDGIAGGRSLLEATGTSYDAGAHCDVCHHIKDVDLSKPPGVGGALILQRPNEKVSTAPNAAHLQVLYGAAPDVPNSFMGGSYQPKFLTSELCAGCHEQTQEALVPGTSIDPVRFPNGLPTHSTYSEWSASPFNGTALTCQYCHMPPDDHGLINSVDTSSVEPPSLTNGFPRTPDRLRKHTFRGPTEGNPRLIDASVTLDITATPANGALSVAVKLSSFTAGHAIPTGEPMRSLLLVVRGVACGVELDPIDGMTLDDWGGARAQGVVGPVAVNGNQVIWSGPLNGVAAGAVVRAVRPTGNYVDYTGVGFFADPTLTPFEKGIEIHAPVGEAVIASLAGAALTLDKALQTQPGDVLFIGDPLVFPPVDGGPSVALAGRAGLSFARTLVDASGARGVPHFLGVDIVSDNRLPPAGVATTQHTFAVPPGCPSADVSAAVIYRKAPLALALERGWDARDVVVSGSTVTAMLP